MSKYTLEDYNRLAYEFAIRNDEVIKLLESNLTDEVAKDLEERFGILTKYEEWRGDEYDDVYSLKALCLEYKHLQHLLPYDYNYDTDKHAEYSDYELYPCNQLKKIVQPPLPYSVDEPIEDSLERIHALIETRGRKLERLMDGSAFEHYDQMTYEKKDSDDVISRPHYPKTGKNRNKPKGTDTSTIENDTNFIKLWSHPSKYLQLLPLRFDLVKQKRDKLNKIISGKHSY